MENNKIKVLLIEDNPDDALIVQEMLHDAKNVIFTMECAQELSSGLEYLNVAEFDVVLLDLTLPDSHGLDTFTKVHNQAPHIPVIVMTGSKDERITTTAMRQGAQDYLIKGQVDINQLERAIRYAIERNNLQKKLTDFYRTISHELRTPLTSIKSAISLLADNSLGTLNDEQRTFLDLIQRNISRLSRLVNNVLDLSRIDARQMHLEMEKHNVRKLLGDVVATLEAETGENKSTITSEVNDDSMNVICDADKITQVLMNLAGNAIKHNSEGTNITLRAQKDGSEVWIEVADDGKGIPEDQLGKIFERFYQLRKSENSEIKGSGLGLAITQGIVEAHGGKVTVESPTGKGTCFRFALKCGS